MSKPARRRAQRTAPEPAPGMFDACPRVAARARGLSAPLGGLARDEGASELVRSAEGEPGRDGAAIIACGAQDSRRPPGCALRDARGEVLVIRVKLLGDRGIDIDVGPLITRAGWDGDPRPRTWWPFDDGWSLVQTTDWRWVEFWTDWSPLRQTQGGSNPPQADGGASELTPNAAAERLTRHGRVLPDCLKGFVPSAGRTEPAAAEHQGASKAEGNPADQAAAGVDHVPPQGRVAEHQPEPAAKTPPLVWPDLIKRIRAVVPKSDDIPALLNLIMKKGEPVSYAAVEADVLGYQPAKPGTIRGARLSDKQGPEGDRVRRSP